MAEGSAFRRRTSNLALVASLAQSEVAAELVKAFQSSNPALVSFVHSLLSGAEIEYFTKNENVHRTVEGGAFAVGPVEFWIRQEDGTACEALLVAVAEVKS